MAKKIGGDPSEVHTYRSTAGGRDLRMLTAGELAAKAVGNFGPGVRIFGFSKGQFSLINLIENLLIQTGPADVVISTWTAAQASIDDAYRLMKGKSVRKLQWLVDFSFPRRQPAYCQRLRQRFGDDAIRVSKTHAKFVLIRNEQWNVCLRTSMNLNSNPRFESFEIDDDVAMCEFLQSVIDDVFEAQPADETFGMKPGEHMEQFDDFGAVEVDTVDDRHLGIDLNDPAAAGAMEVQ